MFCLGDGVQKAEGDSFKPDEAGYLFPQRNWNLGRERDERCQRAWPISIELITTGKAVRWPCNGTRCIPSRGYLDQVKNNFTV